jgi:hypothetical protein
MTFCHEMSDAQNTCRKQNKQKQELGLFVWVLGGD